MITLSIVRALVMSLSCLVTAELVPPSPLQGSEVGSPAPSHTRAPGHIRLTLHGCCVEFVWGGSILLHTLLPTRNSTLINSQLDGNSCFCY